MDPVSEFGEARVAPLSHEQEQLWVLHQLAPRTLADNECAAVTLRGPLDASVLRESLHAVIRRHETWRTVFVSRDGQPVQVVLTDGRCEWSAADVSDSAEAGREAEARRQAQQQVSRPFDLARGPLVRALLVRLGEQWHQLFITWHRIVADRSSVTRVTLPELRELCDARAQRRAADLNTVGLQHSDYAIWQRQHRSDETLQAHLRFWSEHLAGAPTVLELPADHRRQGQLSYPGQTQSFALGAELSVGLRELSKREQVTLRITLTAALQTLLFRCTGQEDLLLGLTVRARPPGPPDRTTGLFTNTLALRGDLAGAPSVRELLSRTRAASHAALSHQDVPLDVVVREMKPERTLAHHPLVQVLLTVEPDPRALPAGWRLVPADIRPPTSRFDLCVEVDERADGLIGRFIYRSDLFEPETIRRMIGHWRMLLEGMAAQPWLPVQQLPMLTEPEREQLLRDWSAGGELAPGPDIVELIDEQVMVRPDDVAVVCGREQLSYRQLDGQASRLARYLRARGVAAEVRVGVCLERSADQVIALIAILRAGGAYVPLDPEAPADRTRHVVRDASMPLILTHERLRDTVAGAGAELVSLDADRAAIERQSVDELDGQPRTERLAYIIYTSGSTGRPKGVMVERGALAAHCRAMIGEYQLGPGDRVLQFSQYSADASLEQILPALAAGARLVVRGPEIWSSRQLLEELRRQQVTVMNLSPAYWHQTIREWAREPAAELAGLGLRLVILGGERLAAQAVREWRELGLPGVRLLNAYGPTEATITATLSEAGEEQEPITIGRPLPGRSVYILDDGGQPVPAGVLGELHIGGPLLARGYLNQPVLTKERFIHDPFGRQPDGRLYRTGDLVRYRPDGRIEYAGRNDEQVKIRGYRIEPGEVEAVLVQYPAVYQAVVVAQGDGTDKELAAFVVTRTGAALPLPELRGYLADQLPRHMRPTIIEQLAEVPRLATGKPDRRRLPKIERAKRRDEAQYVPARLLAEQRLVRIWEELLAPRPIGIRDNFFHLGGNSVLGALLIDRIERAYGKKLALSTLFSKPTVEQLAEALQDGAKGSDETTSIVPLRTEGSRRPFFFLHGDWTRRAFYCFALARACGPDQPFYALEPYRFSALERVPTLEAIAAAHLEAVRGVQARGPYRLGGFCNGGLLAYEMARQLERNGEQVEFLGLIDPSPPVQSSLLRTVCDAAQRATRAGSARRADLYLRARHAQRHGYRRLRPGGNRLRDFGQLLAIEPRLEAMFPPREALYRDYIAALTWVATRYKTGIYSGRITFFWARGEPAIARTWQPVVRRTRAADIEEHAIAGTHMTMITEHIEDLAMSLSSCLARADKRPTSSQAGAGPTTNPVTCKIRPMRLRDVWPVLAIERQAFPEDPWTSMTVKGWLARATRRGQARHATRIARFIRFMRLNEAISLIKVIRLLVLDRPSDVSYVAAEAEDGKIVGYACLTAAPGREASIPLIAVRPDRQGQKIGTALLMDLIATATAAGCRDICLYVRADNSRASRLYRGTGFTKVGILPGFYQPSGTDAVVMRLPLPEPGPE
jgi:amino acid adenylation domain-containing protein